MKINWKQKLSSRKFWAALAGFVSAILIAFQFTEGEVTQAVSVISAAGVLIAYILAEGSVDAAREGKGEQTDRTAE